MEQVTKSIKTGWKNFWRLNNLSLWCYLISFLLGIAFILIWQGVHRIIIFSAVYYKPLRPFVAKWFWLPRDLNEIPDVNYSIWVIISTIFKLIPISLYIGAGSWLLFKLGFCGQNFFCLFEKALVKL